MSIRIITDSTVDTSAAFGEKIAANVPLTITFGEEDYIDGVTINKNEFYDKLSFTVFSTVDPKLFWKAEIESSCIL